DARWRSGRVGPASRAGLLRCAARLAAPTPHDATPPPGVSPSRCPCYNLFSCGPRQLRPNSRGATSLDPEGLAERGGLPMPFATFPSYLTARFHRRRCSREGRPGWHPKRRFVPRLESLEGRALPSIITVLNVDDHGPGSLRDAVMEANANPGSDAIDFAAEVSGTVVLTGGPLTITGSLFVVGPGADRLTVSGNDASRVFEITSGAGVALSGLTIAHGRAVQGAGIDN